MKKYEKPEMKFTEVCTDRAIADTCWGLKAGKSHYNGPFYYDIDGSGFVSFYLTSTDGSCGAPDAYDVKFCVKNADGTVTSSDGSKYETLVEQVLTQKGGNNGQPYQGLSADFPSNPGSMS